MSDKKYPYNDDVFVDDGVIDDNNAGTFEENPQRFNNEPGTFKENPNGNIAPVYPAKRSADAKQKAEAHQKSEATVTADAKSAAAKKKAVSDRALSPNTVGSLANLAARVTAIEVLLSERLPASGATEDAYPVVVSGPEKPKHHKR
jgi:hypothetical protein